MLIITAGYDGSKLHKARRVPGGWAAVCDKRISTVRNPYQSSSVRDAHAIETGEVTCSKCAAQQNMHTDAAALAIKAGDTTPESNPVKPAGSQAAPVM
jgi:hypothetical protein